MSDQYPSEGESKSRFFAESVETHVRVVLTSALWLYIIVNTFFYSVDSLLISYDIYFIKYIVDYKSILFTLSALVYWYVFGNKAFLKATAYFVSYPFIFILWYLPKFTFYLLSGKTINVYVLELTAFSFIQFASSFKYIRARLLSILALFSGIILTSTSNSTFLGIIAIFFLFTYIIIHIFLKVRSAFKKTLPFMDRIPDPSSTSLTKKFQEEILSVRESSEDDNGEEEKTIEENLQEKMQTVLKSMRLILYLKDYILKFKSSYRLSGYLILSLCQTIFSIVISYGFLYYALYQVSHHHFALVPDVTLFHFILYSLGVLFRIDIVGFGANSLPAMGIVATQVLLGFVILVVLLYMLTSLVRRRYDEGMRRLVERMDGEINAMTSMLAQEYDISPSTVKEELTKVTLAPSESDE